MNNNQDCPIRLALYCLPIEADAKLRPALSKLQDMEDAIGYGEKVCAELVKERDAMRGKCGWKLVEPRSGYYEPSCDSSQMILKVFGSRFCPLCGASLYIRNETD